VTGFTIGSFLALLEASVLTLGATWDQPRQVTDAKRFRIAG
jgi:hypothetical protein